MKLKKIATILLLLFVAASVVALVVDEFRPKQGDAPPDQNVPRKVIAYYFYRNMRCPTCRTIQQYSREAVHSGFESALKDGRLEWREVNCDTPGNEHFAKEYELQTSSLVLVDLRYGKQNKWVNLDKVWDLVDDKRAFTEYVQESVRMYLEEDQ